MRGCLVFRLSTRFRVLFGPFQPHFGLFVNYDFLLTFAFSPFSVSCGFLFIIHSLYIIFLCTITSSLSISQHPIDHKSPSD